MIACSLPDVYEDLTAMFASRSMVPNDWSRRDALENFILKNAPEQADDSGGQVDLFPKPGQTAPDFAIRDVNGDELSLASLRGHQNIVLVFSRADW